MNAMCSCPSFYRTLPPPFQHLASSNVNNDLMYRSHSFAGPQRGTETVVEVEKRGDHSSLKSGNNKFNTL